MNKRKLLSTILLGIVIASLTPINVNAEIKDVSNLYKLGDAPVTLGDATNAFGAKTEYRRLLLGSDHYLDTISEPGAVNKIYINKVGSIYGDSILDKESLTFEDCLKFIRALNESRNSKYGLGDGFNGGEDEIAEWFGYGDKKDTSGFRADEVMRDCFTIMAFKKVESDAAKAQKFIECINEIKPGFSGLTGVAKRNLGVDTLDDISTSLQSQIDAVAQEQMDTVNKDKALSIESIDFSKCDETYQHILTVQRLVSTAKGKPVDLTSDFLKGASEAYGDVTEKEIITGATDDVTKLLNKTLTDAYNMGDTSDVTFKACMSLLLQRGSKYNSSDYTIDTDSVKDRLEKGVGNSQADKIIEESLIKAKNMLDANKSITDKNFKLYLTLPYRTRYSMYYMSATSQVKDTIEKYKDIDILCKDGDSSEYTLNLEPYILSKPDSIVHFEGYTYLNNIANDIDKLATVILPTLNKVKSKEDVKSMQLELAELQAAEEAASLMNNPDQLVWLNTKDVDGKYDLSNPSKLSPIEEAWSKKVAIDSNTTISLKEEYDRLKKLGVTFPDLEALQTSTEHPLNKDYFDLSKKQVGASIRVGTALSSTYIPFKTNLYNPITYKLVKDDDEFFRFHAIYGNYRKALYIDTDVASASKLRTTDKVGSLKIATLKDVLSCDKDIVLYADTSFYNMTTLDIYKKESQGSASSTPNADKSLLDKIVDSFNINLSDVLKAKASTEYSERVSKVDNYKDTKSTNYKVKPGSINEAVLDGKTIDQFVQVDDQEDLTYNVMRSYALVSSVYRDNELFHYLKNQGVKPVFVSSKNLASTNGATQTWKDTYYNYILLKNILNNQNVNYKTVLDEGKPVYEDVYGNIVTESGNVVIPAASNATLNYSYSPYTAAFITSYGQKEFIPDTLDFVSDSGASQVMEKVPERKRWEFANKSVNGSVDMNSLSTAINSSMETLFNLYATSIKQGNLNFDVMVPNVIMETLRGAPLENIDKTTESLLVGVDVSSNGIGKAVQLDDFKKSISAASQNSILSLPNLAYINGIEYAIFFVYKLTVIFVLIFLLFQIFRAAMDKGFGIVQVFKMFITIALTLGAIYIVPILFDASYYQLNKLFLQDEVLSVAMLNLEKQEAGVEVGMMDTSGPNINSKLYLKLKSVNMPWIDGFYNIITSNISAKLSDVYKEYYKKDLAFGQDNFEFKNGALYIDVNKLLESSTITFNSNYNNLYDVAKGDTPASFYTPYYVFQHALCLDVNTFNKTNNTYSYSTQVYGGGKVKSLGLIKPYLSSDEFISTDSYGNSITNDILHLREIYQTKGSKPNTIFYTQDDIKKMQESNWYNRNISEDTLNTIIKKLDKEAKIFVADNRLLLGRVSDETFIKMLSLDLAVYYNDLAGIRSADSLDIYNVSSDDLTRLSIANKADVIKDSPLSYSRFIYEEGGTTGVIAAGILEVVNFLDGWLKPIITLFIYLMIFLSLFIYKIVLGRESQSPKGYVQLVASLCLTNLVYALSLKGSMYLPRIANLPTVWIIVQILIQALNVAIYCLLAIVVLMNWRDLGNATFSTSISEVLMKIKHGRLGDLLDFDKIEGSKSIDKLRDLISRRKHRKYTTDYDPYAIDYQYENNNYNNYNDSIDNEYYRGIHRDMYDSRNNYKNTNLRREQLEQEERLKNKDRYNNRRNKNHREYGRGDN